MNERIFKLALKAIDFQGAIDIDTELKMANSELAKFAELIVKECVTVAMRAVSDDEPKEAWYLIKEHFGVDE